MLNLSKGAPALNLTKSAKHLLTGLMLGLKWDGDTDLDVAAVVLKDGKLLGGSIQTALVGYPMHKTDEDGKVTGYNWKIKGADYSGDARNGASEGFDETINFNLTEVEGDEIIMFLTSYSAGEPVSFGATLHPEAVLCDTTGKQMAKVDLGSDAAFGTAFKMVRMFKNGSEWSMENVDELVGSSANGLQDVVSIFN